MVKMTSVVYHTKSQFQLVKITEDVRRFVAEAGIKDGLVAVITAHTTTGIMVNEGLDCLEIDIEETLDRLIPQDLPYAHAHFLPSYGATGSNAPGHLKSMLTGNSCMLPVKDGQLISGHAQDIYLAEYDGPQSRKVFIEVLGE